MNPPDNPDRAEIVVFIVRRNTRCGECGEEVGKGGWIRLENNRALCQGCADLDHLECLPRGDAAVTRRATKYSTLRAVVLQWAPSRKQDERQGILVEPAAIAAHACRKYSGRVGRSARAKEFAADAIRLAVSAHIRHAHTRYDELLMRTGARAFARAEIQGDVECRLAQWRVGR